MQTPFLGKRQLLVKVINMRRLPPLNAVRMFEAAARHSSFLKAAEELHVTHGAVWRQVKQLEEWFGVPLFTRAGRRITPTESGAQFLITAGTVFDRLESGAAALRNKKLAQSIVVNAALTLRQCGRIAAGLVSAIPKSGFE